MSEDSKSTAKVGMNLGMLLGFSDEIQKIAGPTGVSDVTKTLNHTVSNSMKLPKLVAKTQPAAPATHPDPLSSAKTNPPPPVRVGG
jgi:hypothetical protein